MIIVFLILDTTDLENTSNKTTALPVPDLKNEVHDRLDGKEESMLSVADLKSKTETKSKLRKTIELNIITSKYSHIFECPTRNRL